MSSGWRLSFTDPLGNSYVLNDDISSFLERGGLEGFDDVEKELAWTRVPYRHGVVAHGDPYTPARTLSAAIDVGASTVANIKTVCRQRRSAVSPYKAVETPGTLLVEDLDNDVDRAIACWCVRMREVYRGPTARQLIYHFWSEDAFFYDPEEQVETVAVVGPGGLVFPITFPITFTSADIDDVIAVENLGDAPTWPTIRVYGPGENPSLDNTSIDKAISLTMTLDADDYVDINMGDATVSFYDASLGTTTSALAYMDATAEFWPLRVGENSIHVEVGDALNGSVRFSYYLRYLAI